jgi:hypothetical protein
VAGVTYAQIKVIFGERVVIGNLSEREAAQEFLYYDLAGVDHCCCLPENYNRAVGTHGLAKRTRAFS